MTIHGGDIYGIAERSGMPLKRLIDFSASINPLGLPDSAAEAIGKSLTLLRHYPEPASASLSALLEARYALPAGSVLCGNGSTELIYLIPRALKPKRVLVTAPAFSEYEKACRNLGRTDIRRLTLQAGDNFELHPEAFIRAMKGCSLAFLCNPNNPTGRLLKREVVQQIADAAAALNCHLVVDEAFIDFSPEETVIARIRNNPRLIVLRSLTKFYALAGLRIGFCAAAPALSRKLSALKEPWTVNILASAAAEAALGDEDYRQKTFTFLKKEKRFMEESFRKLSLDFIPSAPNYYLFRLKRSRTVLNELAARGVILRDCSNFNGLGEGYVRAAVRSRKENGILFKELARLCQAS